MTVLVISQQHDTTADLVVAALHDRQVPVVRFDLADFPARLRFSAETGKGWAGSIDLGHHRLDLADVRSVYYRRPAPFDLDAGMSDAERTWATKEARHGFGGLLAALDCRWVNHPHANAAAAKKPMQLAAAHAAGLTVPRTLLTNDPDAARAFVADCPNGAVYKSLAGSPDGVGRRALYTQQVTAEHITTQVSATAHLLQERLAKQFEVRVTSVGDQLFGVRIDAGSDAAREDWRSDYDALTYQPIDIPAPVAAGLSDLMSRLGLRFGAHDFVVSPDDTWWFLETNPNGQWGWLAEATGLPIADAIAADLQGDTP